MGDEYESRTSLTTTGSHGLRQEYFAVEHWLCEHSASARAYSYLYSIQFELEDNGTDEAGWIDLSMGHVLATTVAGSKPMRWG